MEVTSPRPAYHCYSTAFLSILEDNIHFLYLADTDSWGASAAVPPGAAAQKMVVWAE